MAVAAVLVDTNVVLDMLAKREPWYRAASDLLFLAAQGKVHLAVSGSTITDLYYLMNKQVYHDAAKSKEVIFRLLDFFSVLDVGYAECLGALASPVADYEDAVFVEAARRAGVEAVITRDTQDFRAAPLPMYTPDEYLNMLVSNTTR
ncbi:MAG: PIN domain-containing protein [Coriobacteriales bacterium]|jgi:predicted nucleic acid-binding protein|nr:PIN domain-containing protein [Coriobacteriales bacterium]